MQVYFSNKTCNRYRKINLPTGKPPMPAQRLKSAVMAAQVDMKDKIQLVFKNSAVPKVKANPNLFLVNLDTVLLNSQSINMEFLDDLRTKNEKKRADYAVLEELMQLKPQTGQTVEKGRASLPNMPLAQQPQSPPPASFNVPYDPYLHGFGSTELQKKNSAPLNSQNVNQFVNLTGLPYDKAKKYIDKSGGSLQKAWIAYGHEQTTIRQFIKRENTSYEQAEFALQMTNFNISQATRLFRQHRK